MADLVKDTIETLYPDQFEEVTSLLQSAFEKQENNSLLLLSRTKQTVHAFLNKVEIKIKEQATALEKRSKHLKVVRVNSILNNSEPKIL